MPRRTSIKRAEGVFREWLARTGDPRIAAERAGVSERTARRWRAAAPAPTTRPLSGAPSALVGQPTRFFGRRDVALRKLLTDGARIVTVLGPAGIGKTRVALRYAELAEGAYDAIHFCDLSEARTVDAVVAVVARVLGLAGRVDVDAVGYALEARGRVLLILDNFEGAVDAAPETAGRWSAIARKAHVIATSRVQLRVVGEACLVLEPLAVPTKDAPDPTQAEAVQLLLDRARLVRADLELGPDDAEAAAEIVRKLDGNALAIELAAARLAVLSPSQLLARLAKRFDVLVGGARDASARQTSMRIALDGSWELLRPEERDVLADVSVFAGGFALDAAEHVAGSVLDVLDRLRQASLVFTRATSAGEVRFGIYETIREYAAERAEALGRTRRARDRHLDFFARAVATWRAEIDGEASARARTRIAHDQDDVLAALRHAIATGARAQALALAANAGPLLTGRVESERALYAEVLGAFPERDAAALEVLFLRGDAARRAGDVEASVVDHSAALERARALGDRRIEALAELGLGNARHAAGRGDEALAHFARALETARAAGDDLLAGRVLSRTAMTHRMRQDTDRGVAAAEEALAIFERRGGRRELADTLCTLATLHQRKGELGRARARYEEALPFVDDADPNVAGPFHGNFGTLYNQLGEIDEARASFARSLAIFARAGTRRLEAISLGNLAGVDFEIGRHDDARQKLERVVRMLQQVGDASHGTFFTGQLGAVLATMGQVDEGEALIARAEASAEHAPWDAALSLHRGFVELARAAIAEANGEADVAASLRERVRARVAASPAHAVDDVRVAGRMLARALDRPSRAAAPRPAVGALSATEDAATIWLPTAEKVSLAKRGAVRLVLRRLIEEHGRGAGVLTVDDLLAAGWPGERVLRDAGASRVYVALGTLRKLGLRDLILSRDGGYLLDPTLTVVVLPAS